MQGQTRRLESHTISSPRAFGSGELKNANENFKRKNGHRVTLSDLSIILKQSGHHMTLYCLVTISIS